MRKIVLLLTLILSLGAGVRLMAEKEKSPIIYFDERTYDFGNIPENGGPVTHAFTFTNNGDAPLVILDARASCGCTRPKHTARPVQPGESGEVTVTFLPEGRPGEFTKTVTVKTNDPKMKKITIRIKGVVIPCEQ